MDRFLWFALFAVTSIIGYGQDKETANTLKLTGTSRPKATINDIAWLAGHWKGTALGGVTEELWSPPQANTMMGSYRLIKDDTVTVFYEIVTIVEESSSLAIRLKHFNKDLTGWEEKNEVREFKLVRKERNKLWFEGMTFEVLDENNFQVFLAIQKRNGDGRSMLSDDGIKFNKNAVSNHSSLHSLNCFLCSSFTKLTKEFLFSLKAAGCSLRKQEMMIQLK
jgi:hypothetical protein